MHNKKHPTIFTRFCALDHMRHQAATRADDFYWLFESTYDAPIGGRNFRHLYASVYTLSAALFHTYTVPAFHSEVIVPMPYSLQRANGFLQTAHGAIERCE